MSEKICPICNHTHKDDGTVCERCKFRISNMDSIAHKLDLLTREVDRMKGEIRNLNGKYLRR